MEVKYFGNYSLVDALKELTKFLEDNKDYIGFDNMIVSHEYVNYKDWYKIAVYYLPLEGPDDGA